MSELILAVPTEDVLPLEAVVRAYIEWGLARCEGDVAEAADLLQISREVLRAWGLGKSPAPGATVRIVDRDELSTQAAPAHEAPTAPVSDEIAATSVGYV